MLRKNGWRALVWGVAFGLLSVSVRKIIDFKTGGDVDEERQPSAPDTA